MIKYSVIIPFHSNYNLLSLCIEALTSTLDPKESEIIIVDNNIDGSQILEGKDYASNCKIIRKKENLMYPRAINIGVAEAQGEYLIFCDADTCVCKDFHKGLSATLEKENIGYASAKLLDMQNSTIKDFGITSSFYNFPHPYFGRNAEFELCKNDIEPLAACAACSMIKRKLFIDIGGFDEKLIHSYSDIDLCLRLKELGYKTVCSANSLAFHQGSSTFGSGMSASLKEDTKGIFMSKHKNIPIQIQQYLDSACDYFLKNNTFESNDYFVLDCSTIGNPNLYIKTVMDNFRIKECGIYSKPFSRRDASHIDLLNQVSCIIRNYKIPILYFVDQFTSFQGNELWKYCRKNYLDIVVDRHANIELLHNI